MASPLLYTLIVYLSLVIFIDQTIDQILQRSPLVDIARLERAIHRRFEESCCILCVAAILGTRRLGGGLAVVRSFNVQLACQLRVFGNFGEQHSPLLQNNLSTNHGCTHYRFHRRRRQSFPLALSWGTGTAIDDIVTFYLPYCRHPIR